MRYAGKTIIQIAQERGSAAKTKTGAWKYLLAHLPGPNRPRCSSAYEHEIWIDNQWHRRADGRAQVLGYYVGYDDPATPGNIQMRLDEEARQREEDRHYTITRNQYGELIRLRGARAEEPPADLAQFAAAQRLVQLASTAGVIDRAYDTISWDHRGRANGEALHHELYDAAANAVVICLRKTVGSKYGVATSSKNYWLIERAEDGELAATPTQAPIAKYAKLRQPLGAIVAHLQGECKLSLTAPAVRGYKAVAVAEDGTLRSVWDGSEWPIGQPRIERVQDDHGGGYYYYRSLNQLIIAAAGNKIFGASKSHRRLALVEVEASGRQIEYGDGKYAATRIMVLSQIGSLL